jgi:disulfide bond formation protein DsbB
MPPLVSDLNFLLACATLLSHIFFVGLIVAFFFRKKSTVFGFFFENIETFILPLSFFLTIGAVILSLVYSEVFGFIPCGLCWVQRIFLYPQAILLGMAWWKKDSRIADYIITLSLFGAIFALDQHLLQMGVSSGIPCPTSGSTDCAKRILFEFGYITFPMLSFTAFMWQTGLMFLLVKTSKK